MQRGNGGTRYEIKWLPRSCWGAPGRKFRYWNKMNVGSCWGTQGRNLRYWNKVNARSCGEARAGGGIDIQTIWAQRYWTHMTMHARSCGETRGRSLDLGNRMNAGSCWEAQVCESLRISKKDAYKKLRGGHGGATYETTWMQEVVEGHRGEV